MKSSTQQLGSLLLAFAALLWIPAVSYADETKPAAKTAASAKVAPSKQISAPSSKKHRKKGKPSASKVKATQGAKGKSTMKTPSKAPQPIAGTPSRKQTAHAPAVAKAPLKPDATTPKATPVPPKTSTSAHNQTQHPSEGGAAFVDRDGDGISDGQEHRFRRQTRHRKDTTGRSGLKQRRTQSRKQAGRKGNGF